MSIKSDLSRFYTANAKHYYQTRQKFWADGERIIKAIGDLSLEKPRILELGCGGGRFLTYLKNNYKGDFSYVGVDMSEGLLDLAKKDHLDAEFLLGDMSQILNSFGSESFDIIVACASFQHLPEYEERITVMNEAYRLLSYEGKLLMLNWSFSLWFIKNHWKIFIRSIFQSFFSAGKWNWRDVFVPWKNGNFVEERYYHLFSLDELARLAKEAGFSIHELCYVDKASQVLDSRIHANNSRICAKKTIFK